MAAGVRKTLTPEQKSARHAARYNQKQRNRLPLFMESGLEQDLLAKGILKDREADDALRSHEQYFNHLAEGRRQAALRANTYQHAFKSLCPDVYVQTLLYHRRMRSRYPSLRDPYTRADYWMTALQENLTHQSFLYVLDMIRPEHAEVLRHQDEWERQWAAKQAKGEYAAWQIVSDFTPAQPR